jgi:hypothetical protein
MSDSRGKSCRDPIGSDVALPLAQSIKVEARGVYRECESDQR